MEMGWDDTNFFPGDFGGGGGIDTSYTPSDYGSADASSYDMGAGLYSPQIGTQQSASDQWAQIYGGGSAAPGAGASQGMIPGLGGLGGLNSLQGLLGLGGGLAGLGGLLAGGGQTGATMPKMGTAQVAQMNQANQAIQPAALGQLPLQQQQAGMLQALSQGQIPPGFAQLVANAYDPMYQQAATRSVDAARRAGFYDNPLSSPVGGAIMGPAAAQLQGQQANSLLGLLQTLPQLFNQPIGNQIGAAQSQSGNLLNAARMGTGQTQSQPLGPQIGQAIGGGLQGMSQSIGQAQQQNSLNQLLQNQMQGQGGIGTTGSMY